MVTLFLFSSIFVISTTMVAEKQVPEHCTGSLLHIPSQGQIREQLWPDPPAAYHLPAAALLARVPRGGGRGFVNLAKLRSWRRRTGSVERGDLQRREEPAELRAVRSSRSSVAARQACRAIGDGEGAGEPRPPRSSIMAEQACWAKVGDDALVKTDARDAPARRPSTSLSPRGTQHRKTSRRSPAPPSILHQVGEIFSWSQHATWWVPPLDLQRRVQHANDHVSFPGSETNMRLPAHFYRSSLSRSWNFQEPMVFIFSFFPFSFLSFTFIRLPPTRHRIISTPSRPPPAATVHANQALQLQMLARRHRLHQGFDVEQYLLSLATAFTYSSVVRNGPLHRLCRPTFNRRFARSSIRVYAPLAPLRPLADEFVCVIVSYVLIWSMDHVVLRSSMKDRYVTWLLNI